MRYCGYIFVAFVLNRTFAQNDGAAVEDDLLTKLNSLCKLNRKTPPISQQNAPLNVKPSLSPLRFLEIDEVQQRFSFVARFSIHWNNTCVKNSWNTLGGADVNRITAQSGDFWRVPLVHITAVENVVLTQGSAQDSFTIFSPNGDVKWMTYFRVDSHCYLDLKAFPYDTQICSVKFEYLLDSSLVNTTDMTAYYYDDFMSPASVWFWENITATPEFKEYSNSGGLTYCQPTYKFYFKRKSSSYVISIILPSVALTALQLAFAFMPPGDTNRPLYCATIMMAFLLMETLIQGSLPKTSETVLMVVFIGIQMIIGVFCTIYALLACMIWECCLMGIRSRARKRCMLSGLRIADMVIASILVVIAAFSAIIIFFKMLYP